MSRSWKCILLWQISMFGGAFEKEATGDEKEWGIGLVGKWFPRGLGHIKYVVVD